MNKKLIHYFLPIFIAIYFFIAFIPIVAKLSSEIFPFFSFRLYSKIPNGFERYDLLYNKGTKHERFLLHNNNTLNIIERRSYNKTVVKISKDNMNQSKTVDEKLYRSLLEQGKTVHLVKLKGDFIEAVVDDNYKVDIINKLK